MDQRIAIPIQSSHAEAIAMTDKTRIYVDRWFIGLDTMVRRSGGTQEEVNELLRAEAAPRVVYGLAHGTEWWSALGSRTGTFAPSPPADGMHWYTPASLYWLRRGLMILRSGGTADAAARANRNHFERQFGTALQGEPLAIHGFPGVFENGTVASSLIAGAAAKEWDAWQYGGYAVCLKSFTGSTCVQKEALGSFLKQQRLGDAGSEVSDSEIIDLIERLDALLLPFAPFQRPTCTPGLTIDRLLAHLNLGFDEPFLGHA